MDCKQVCLKYEFKEAHRNWGLYKTKIKRCSICNKYLELFDQQCPCCKNTLKSKTKKVKEKNKIHQNFIYKKFLFKLNLNRSIINQAKNLEEGLMKKLNFSIAPQVMATACTYMIIRNDHSITMEDILDVYKIPEVELRHCMAMICENLVFPEE